MYIALLGLSGSGKKTMFELMTRRSIPPGRKPDEVVEGIASIRDPRVDRISSLVKPNKITYAENRFALCPDVTLEERPWMDGARKADLLCMVVRGFGDPSVFHPQGSVNPDRDVELLSMELAMADLELIDRRLERMAKEKRAGQTTAQAQEEKVLLKSKAALEADPSGRERRLELEPHELLAVRSLGLFILKPLLWVRNVDEGDVAAAELPGLLSICIKIEREIADISDEAERKQYLEMMGLTAPGVDRVNAAAYERLGLMSFYTMGVDEVRAWTIRKGARAPEAAGRIHTDIERGFIRAEVIKYDDLMDAGSEEAVKARGKAYLKGKEYVIEDGDICHFRFSV